MDNNRARRVCKCLLILWFVLLFLIGSYFSIQIEAQDPIANSNMASFSVRYQLFVSAYILFCSAPLLFTIRNYAEKAGMKISKSFANIMLFQHIIWITFQTLEIVFRV
jgi:hypothetical protein